VSPFLLVRRSFLTLCLSVRWSYVVVRVSVGFLVLLGDSLFLTCFLFCLVIPRPASRWRVRHPRAGPP
jgi:hypothetical protein